MGEGRERAGCEVAVSRTVVWRTAPIPRPPEEAETELRAVLLADGRVLLTGGSVSAVLDVAAGAWSATTGPMIRPRREHGLLALEDGRVLAAGGIGEEGTTEECELFDPANGTWRRAPPLPAPRRNLVLVDAGGRVLAIGGKDRARYGTSSVTAWTPGSDDWRSMTAMHASRPEPLASVLADGSVIVTDHQTAERWDPETEAWSSIMEIPFGQRDDVALGAWTGRTAAFALPDRVVVLVALTGAEPAAHIARL
jgi:hypothetical protein